eukprot:6374924-Lingulodinium_polyedra.AAC.1
MPRAKSQVPESGRRVREPQIRRRARLHHHIAARRSEDAAIGDQLSMSRRVRSSPPASILPRSLRP